VSPARSVRLAKENIGTARSRQTAGEFGPNLTVAKCDKCADQPNKNRMRSPIAVTMIGRVMNDPCPSCDSR